MKKYILVRFVFTITVIVGFAAEIQTSELKNSTQQTLSPAKSDEIQQTNHHRFAALKKLNLPIGQYVVIGSGPLGIRNLREIGDIDIVVGPELQKILAAKYGVTDDGQVKKIVFPEDDIEAFWEGSFYTQQNDDCAPTMAEIIAQAEIIDGLPFESLEHVLYFKRKIKRDKDLKDILLIEEWQKNTQSCSYKLISEWDQAWAETKGIF